MRSASPEGSMKLHTTRLQGASSYYLAALGSMQVSAYIINLLEACASDGKRSKSFHR